jgi:hypothetical protein
MQVEWFDSMQMSVSSLVVGVRGHFVFNVPFYVLPSLNVLTRYLVGYRRRVGQGRASRG